MAITFTLNGTSTLDETAGLQNLASGPDADNDVLFSTLPTTFSARLTALSLPSTFPTNVGVGASPNNLIHVAFDGSLTSLGLTQSTGANFTGQASGVTTADGQTVYLWTDTGAGNLGTKVVFGTTSNTVAPGGGAGSGDVVFAVYMTETNGAGTVDVKLWTVTYEALQHPTPGSSYDEPLDIFQNVHINATGTTFFSFDQLPSGANLFGMVGTDATSPAIIVFGRTPILKPDNTYSNTSDVIHTSQGGDGATIGVNNQMFDAGEGAYFTYVNNPVADFLSGVPGGLTSTEADDADNIQYTGGLNPSTGASLFISQTQGNAEASLKLTTFKLDAAYQTTALTTNRGGSGDDQINITAVKVFDAANNDVTGTKVTITGGVATVTGLLEGYRVEWTSAAPHVQVLVEAVAGKFDIGGFALSVGANNHQSLANHVFVEDDGPNAALALKAGVDLLVDETGLTPGPVTDTDTAANLFTFSSGYGIDGAGTTAWSIAPASADVDSGLDDVATGSNILLHAVSATLIEGRVGATTTVAFSVTIDASTGALTLTENRPIKHPTNDPNETLTMAADLISASLTVTDRDGDVATATDSISEALKFRDDGPSATLALKADVDLIVDETGLPGVSDSDTAANLFTFTTGYGVDGAGTTAWSIAPSSNDVDSGLDDVATGSNILLHTVSATLIEGRVGATTTVAFTVAIDASTGSVTVTENRAIKHPDATNPDETLTMTAGLISATLTVTDKDGDVASATDSISEALKFKDDGPAITVPASPGGSAGAPLVVSNAAGGSASGAFGFNVGADQPGTYSSTVSDFVDANGALAGVQLTLTGTVSGPPSVAITSPVVTLGSESATAASFNFSFDYDRDPITAGVQTGTATGTLAFNKVADTYTVTISAPVESFSINILHTTELLAKNPTGNTGHPLIVVEKLAGDDTSTGSIDEDFYVQFTADSTPLWFTPTGDGPIGANDTVFTGANHDLAGGTEVWVSATQDTNGVSGDTIQKDELLTLRFFSSDILSDATPPVNEQTAPTAVASGVAIEFDGIGASEDLIVILDLKNMNGGPSITRAIAVNNGDLYKTGEVPAPYTSEFTIDNNDALLVIEANDYNLPGENYQIQGIQIMQSANGLTGQAINLNRAVGPTGGSSTNGAFAFQSFTDASFGNEQDVLKIVDMGFIQTIAGTQDAHLDFALQIRDADGDTTATQHLFVDFLA